MLKKKYKLILVAGARPNFMKIAPIIRELRMHRDQRSEVGCQEKTDVRDRISDVGGVQKKEDGGQITRIEYKIVHTGQHYDYEMSQAFFDDLEIPRPDYFLEAGSGSHAEQTAKIMTTFEKVCLKEKPSIVIVVGDVNSTLACSINDKSMKMQWIKEQVGKGNYQLKLHAVERASIRGIDPLEVKEALLNGEIIEDYPEDKRGHSCLVYGKTRIGRDIHVLCGMAYDILWIITVYEPDPAEWVNPKKRRIVK